MDNPETLATLGTQDEDKQNTNTQHNTTQKTKMIIDTDYTKTEGNTGARGKLFLLLINHPPCYSYIHIYIYRSCR